MVPPRDDFDDLDDAHGPGRWIASLIVLLGLLAGAAYQFGYLDDVIERFLPAELDFVELPASEEPQLATVDEPVPDDDPVGGGSRGKLDGINSI